MPGEWLIQVFDSLLVRNQIENPRKIAASQRGRARHRERGRARHRERGRARHREREGKIGRTRNSADSTKARTSNSTDSTKATSASPRRRSKSVSKVLRDQTRKAKEIYLVCPLGLDPTILPEGGRSKKACPI